MYIKVDLNFGRYFNHLFYSNWTDKAQDGGKRRQFAIM